MAWGSRAKTKGADKFFVSKSVSELLWLTHESVDLKNLVHKVLLITHDQRLTHESFCFKLVKLISVITNDYRLTHESADGKQVFVGTFVFGYVWAPLASMAKWLFD